MRNKNNKSISSYPKVSSVGNGTEKKVPFPRSLIEKFNTWRISFSVDPYSIIKGAVLFVLLILLTLVQTSFFPRFMVFGIVPDIVFPFVICVSIKEKEKWGAVTGLVSAFVIDAAGGTQITLLPLLYVSYAIAVGLLMTYRFRDTFLVVVLFTAVGSILRSVLTLVIVLIQLGDENISYAISNIVLPELGANLIFAAFPHLLTRLCLMPFHRKSEKQG